MKRKFFVKIVAAFIGALMLFGFWVSPLLVGAESVADSAETSSEFEDETSDEYGDYDFEKVGNTYYYVNPENNSNVIKLTILEEKKLQVNLYVDNEAVASINATYDIEGDIISIYAMDEWIGDLTLSPDGTAVDVVHEEQFDEMDSSSDAVFEEDSSAELTAPIISGFAGLVGAALLYLAFSGKMGKLKEAFDAILSWFKKKGEELATEEVDLKNIKEGFLKAVQSNEYVQNLLLQAQEKGAAEYQAMLIAIKSLAEDMASSVQSMKEYYEAKAALIEAEYKQIKSILIKLASDNSMLVRNGVADEIVKEIEKGVEVETE